jgi:cytochrome c553
MTSASAKHPALLPPHLTRIRRSPALDQSHLWRSSRLWLSYIAPLVLLWIAAFVPGREVAVPTALPILALLALAGSRCMRMTHVHSLVAISGIAVAALGCGHSEAASAPPGTTPRAERDPGALAVTQEAGEPAAPDRAAHMQATFWLAVVARDAVISGELETAKLAADSLAQHDFGGSLPEDWKHWVAQMQQRAGDVALAPDLAAAAQSVAALSLACGDCHAQKRRTPKLHGQQALAWKDAPEDLRERMYRYGRGAEQLWHGLIQPSDAMWLNGTATLTRAPVQPALRAGEQIGPAMAHKIEEIRALARRARVARSHPERAAIYGELITRCADCHFVAREELAD